MGINVPAVQQSSLVQFLFTTVVHDGAGHGRGAELQVFASKVLMCMHIAYPGKLVTCTNLRTLAAVCVVYL
jgi:hypothetical protein